MKITAITFFPHRLKRRYRWQTASYTADAVQLFYVKVQGEDGFAGVGAASVMPKEDSSFAPGLEAMRAATQAVLVGHDIREIDSLLSDVERRVQGYPRHFVALDGTLGVPDGPGLGVTLGV